MRVFKMWIVVLLFLPVSALLAQEGVPEGSTIKLLLLRQKSIQKELALGDDTTKKIMDFTHAQSEAAGKAAELGEAARKEAMQKLSQQNDKFLTDTLTEKQGKRLGQLAMQFSPLTHLLKPEMVKDLKLSEEQVTKLKDVQTDTRKALFELLKSKEAKEKSEKFTKLREETVAKIKSVLTDNQETRVRELAGPIFKGEIVFEGPKDE